MTPRIERQLRNGVRPIPLALGIVLYWIAGADGDVSADESDFLRNYLADLGMSGFLSRGEWEALPLSHEEIAFACQRIWQIQDPGARAAFLLEALSLALIDRRLTATENHILRLVNDLLRLPPSALGTAFSELTGKDLPEPSDVSIPAWWQERQSGSGARDGDARRPSSGSATAHGSLRPELTRAFYVLGLEPGASRHEIKAAYRRMSQVHHPDRFASLGPEAVQAATHSFQRITDAYSLLLAQ